MRKDFAFSGFYASLGAVIVLGFVNLVYIMPQVWGLKYFSQVVEVVSKDSTAIFAVGLLVFFVVLLGIFTYYIKSGQEGV